MPTICEICDAGQRLGWLDDLASVWLTDELRVAGLSASVHEASRVLLAAAADEMVAPALTLRRFEDLTLTGAWLWTADGIMPPGDRLAASLAEAAPDPHGALALLLDLARARHDDARPGALRLWWYECHRAAQATIRLTEGDDIVLTYRAGDPAHGSVTPTRSTLIPAAWIVAIANALPQPGPPDGVNASAPDNEGGAQAA